MHWYEYSLGRISSNLAPPAGPLRPPFPSKAEKPIPPRKSAKTPPRQARLINLAYVRVIEDRNKNKPPSGTDKQGHRKGYDDKDSEEIGLREGSSIR